VSLPSEARAASYLALPGDAALAVQQRKAARRAALAEGASDVAVAVAFGVAVGAAAALVAALLASCAPGLALRGAPVEPQIMIEIPLSRGYVALIDDEDAHLAAFKWSLFIPPGKKTMYATRKDPERGTLRLHREVLGVTDPAVEVDHEDGNGLDCRRHNLRSATAAQNRRNAPMYRTNTTGFKGVAFRKGPRRRPWRAQITVDYKPLHLGHHLTAEEAARAYDAAARELHGEFAWLNFPGPGERGRGSPGALG
jgi:hypothetical protein